MEKLYKKPARPDCSGPKDLSHPSYSNKIKSRTEEGKRKKSNSIFSSHGGISGLDTTTNLGCGRMCRVDYLSSKGKYLHLAKLLAVVGIPILGGWCFTMYSLADNVLEKDSVVEAQLTMVKAIRLGRLIYTIQKERDMSILYISNIGPGTKAFLIDEYDKTDKSFDDMWSWPLEFAVHPQQHFRTKKRLIAHINRHRTQLDPKLSEVFSEIKFYSDIVDFFMEWMVSNIKDSGFGDTWKTLVVFQKITRCMLDAGAERAYGSMFFAQGNFPDQALYDNYFRRIARFNYNYKSAAYYSDLVDALIDVSTEIAYTKSIRSLRAEIRYSNFTGNYKSLLKAEDYFDNATFRIDYLFGIQERASLRVSRRINSTINNYVVGIVIYSVTASLVVLSCPIIFTFSEALTSNMQAYSKLLLKASGELDEEKNKTEYLLYQMLPKMVAERLKRNSKVESEFFKQSTVMFTSIVNFVKMSIEYSPMKLIDLLNVLYSSIDDRISQYDVYKVETINDTYMVVSGVPVPNGMRHASEIAYLALDVVGMMAHNSLIMSRLNCQVQLLVGINSGSVSAGVVGTVMLRYCLFGDTVNTASRMRSHGLPNRIHISESTHRNLKGTDCFHMQKRGILNIKGKGNMTTYWLTDTSSRSEQRPSSRDIQLPGEVDSTNEMSSTTSTMGIPVTSAGKTCNQKATRKNSSALTDAHFSYNMDEPY